MSSLAKPLYSPTERPLIPELTVGFPVAPQHHISVAVVHSLDVAVYKQQCCYTHCYSRYSLSKRPFRSSVRVRTTYEPPVPVFLFAHSSMRLLLDTAETKLSTVRDFDTHKFK